MATGKAQSVADQGPNQSSTISPVVIFLIEKYRLGLPLGSVQKVVRIVDITPLPKAPPIVSGLINIEGRVVPVINTRRRFDLPDRDIALSDHLVVVNASRRAVALWVDVVTDLVEFSEQDFVTAETVVPGLEHLRGVIKLPGGIVLVHDLDKFLSLEEEQSLDDAIRDA